MILVDHGADVNAADNQGKTPLMLCANATHTSVAKYLLRKGANIDLIKGGGVSILSNAQVAFLKGLMALEVKE